MFSPNMRKTAILLLAVCGLWPALALRSQPSPAQQTGPANLAAIHATGSKRWTPEQIAASCGLTPGQTITRDDFQAADHWRGR